MLNRLLFAHQKPAQLIVAVFGALIGLLLLLGALQLYFDFRAVLNGNSDLSKPQYLVINKEVNLLNTLFGGQKGFTENEFASLREVKGVRDVAPLTSSQFPVSVSMGGGVMEGMPGMATEFFFEAVPDNFVDVDAEDWQWHEGDSLVPIILPRDYIKLYNFGFAPSQGLPQMTEGIVKLARFNINITDKSGRRIVYQGKLAAFSERINTILAPQSFIDFANEKFAAAKKGSIEPNRVIIQCEGPATAELADYFAENGYETSAEALRNSKLNSFLQVLMYIVVAVGLVIIILAMFVFLLYSQLLVSKSNYELETLIRIGYNYKTLGKIYVKYYAMIYAGIFVVCIPALWLPKMWFQSYMQAKGFELPPGLSSTVIVTGLCFTFLFLAVNTWSVFAGLKRLAK
ncbi:MAG: FtsX-like permease family protein [Bacteroidia bacterium]